LADDCAASGAYVRFRPEPAAETARFVGEVEIAIFRIAQEAIHNALRHAKADHIEVVLACPDETVVLQVIDDGAGFDPSSVVRGMGLNTMHHRTDALEGEFTLSSAPGRTVVEARIPLKAPPS